MQGHGDEEEVSAFINHLAGEGAGPGCDDHEVDSIREVIADNLPEFSEMFLASMTGEGGDDLSCFRTQCSENAGGNQCHYYVTFILTIFVAMTTAIIIKSITSAMI